LLFECVISFRLWSQSEIDDRNFIYTNHHLNSSQPFSSKEGPMITCMLFRNHCFILPNLEPSFSFRRLPPNHLFLIELVTIQMFLKSFGTISVRSYRDVIFAFSIFFF
jgi:hypothetical protein